jgi:hypothetical protein
MEIQEVSNRLKEGLISKNAKKKTGDKTKCNNWRVTTLLTAFYYTY